MTRPSDVALEVWLGPMEGLRFVTPGGSRPAVIRVGRAAVDKKSNQRNEVVLPYDLGISATHAELRSERGRLVLKDAPSRNGTFAQSARVTGEKEIQSGDVFLVSLTPVRVFFVEEPLAELPSPTVLNVSAWREPVVQNIVRLVQETAARRGEPFADTRHLFDAFLRSGSPFVERTLRKANWSPQRALVELWDGSLLVGRHTWLKDLLLRLTDVRTGAGSGELMLAPKVEAALEECQRDPVESSAIDVEQVVLDRLLRGLMQDAESLVGAWLARRLPVHWEEDETARLPGPIPERAPKPKPKPEPEPGSEPELDLKREPEPEPEPKPELDPKPKPVPEPEPYPRSDDGEQKRWADLTPPEPKEKSTPEDEPKLVDETYGPNAMEKRLRRRVAELERRLAEAESRAVSASRTSSADAVLPWRTLLDQDDKGNSDLETALALLREVLRFSQDVEKFVLSQVQAMTMPGALTSSFHLPGFQNGLLAYLTSIAEGKEVDPDELRAYFTELKCWQIAISAGNHEAPKLWFGTLWKRINPSVIEAGNPGAKWNFLWEATDWWKAYRTLVEDLNADLVQDEVHKEAAKFAQTEFQKLSKRRK